jgi:hypothetical protein
LVFSGRMASLSAIVSQNKNGFVATGASDYSIVEMICNDIF